MTVRSVLRNKAPEVWSVRPNATVLEALALMAVKDIGAVAVMDKGRLVGMFSERDYARKVVLVGRTSEKTMVRAIMTSPVYSVTPDRTLQECMILMTRRKVRHLPVLEREQLIGMVSMRDVVNATIKEQAFEIEQLGNYISGSRG